MNYGDTSIVLRECSSIMLACFTAKLEIVILAELDNDIILRVLLPHSA